MRPLAPHVKKRICAVYSTAMVNLAVGIAIGYVLGRWGKYIKALAKRAK
jgi:hypothetical protein